MLILGNYKGNYDTATTTAIKSMGFDLNVTQSYFSYKYFLTESGQHLMLVGFNPLGEASLKKAGQGLSAEEGWGATRMENS